MGLSPLVDLFVALHLVVLLMAFDHLGGGPLDGPDCGGPRGGIADCGGPLDCSGAFLVELRCVFRIFKNTRHEVILVTLIIIPIIVIVIKVEFTSSSNSGDNEY